MADWMAAGEQAMVTAWELLRQREKHQDDAEEVDDDGA